VSDTEFVHCFTTHMQSAGHAHEKEQTASVRMSQVCALKEFIDDCVYDKGPRDLVLMMGDFNINALPRDGQRHEYEMLLNILRGRVHAGDRSTKEAVPATAGHHKIISFDPIQFEVRDVALERYGGQHPITHGDVTKEGEPVERLLTAPERVGCAECVDYSLVLRAAEDIAEGPMVDVKSTRIERFQVEGEEFSHLSGRFCLLLGCGKWGRIARCTSKQH
jgi:hypothetical protein